MASKVFINIGKRRYQALLGKEDFEIGANLIKIYLSLILFQLLVDHFFNNENISFHMQPITFFIYSHML